MATTESDYYELLGVPRTATEAEIKSAFRTLARELHPDVSTEPDAGARFRDVAEAYEVLSDPERRATYDRYGKAGLRRGGFESAFTDFGNLSDIFAAFFGDDLLGGGRQRRARKHTLSVLFRGRCGENRCHARHDRVHSVQRRAQSIRARGEEPRRR